jgi:hypothetical protein
MNNMFFMALPKIFLKQKDFLIKKALVLTKADE